MFYTGTPDPSHTVFLVSPKTKRSTQSRFAKERCINGERAGENKMAWLGCVLVTNVQVYHDIYRGDEDFGCNENNHNPLQLLIMAVAKLSL